MRQPTFDEIKTYYDWAVKQFGIGVIENVLGIKVKNYELHGNWESDDQGGSYFSLHSVSGKTTDGDEFEIDNDADWKTIDQLSNVSTHLADDYYSMIYVEAKEAPLNLQVIENE